MADLVQQANKPGPLMDMMEISNLLWSNPRDIVPNPILDEPILNIGAAVFASQHSAALD